MDPKPDASSLRASAEELAQNELGRLDTMVRNDELYDYAQEVGHMATLNLYKVAGDWIDRGPDYIGTVCRYFECWGRKLRIFEKIKVFVLHL